MSQIKSTNTKAEILVRRALHAKGLRFRIHDKNLRGKPDIVFRSQKLAIFVDGDFWHGRSFNSWSARLSPKWRKKIEGNKKRDAGHSRILRKTGWIVIRVWESQVERDLDRVTEKIEKAIYRKTV